jgi:class I fructose-bisphosphate aldolase
MTEAVDKILSWYESDNPGVKTNLARLFYQGKLGGTGKLIILPVDQGFEHGPDRCFVVNPAAYNPHYHFQLAIDAGLSAFASPLGMLEAGAATFAGKIPLILKVNSSNLLFPKEGPKTQAVTATVQDALRLGCVAVGLTIYPGSIESYDMFEVAREFIGEAKEVGLPTVIWSYPRGEDLSKDGETAIDVATYATQMAALLGAHIIKVKLPTAFVEAPDVAEIYRKGQVKIDTLPDRIKLVLKAALGGRRIVIFSGGGKKSDGEILDEVKAIKEAGGNGSIIGRNSFQRSREDALKLLGEMVEIYKN